MSNLREALDTSRAPLEIDSYRDGGTLVIRRAGKTYHVDFRIGHQDTHGAWTYAYPSREPREVVSPDEVESVLASVERGYRCYRMAYAKLVSEPDALMDRVSVPPGTKFTWLPPQREVDLPDPVPGLIAPALEADGTFQLSVFVAECASSSRSGGVTIYGTNYHWMQRRLYL